jgi:phosphotriesterase-related protein
VKTEAKLYAGTPAGRMMTVNGPLALDEAGVTDAHSHAWIAPVAGAEPGSPVLFDQTAITAELIDFRQAGGGTLIDCQPGGCGRDGRMLVELSRASGVHIVACTGFHLKRYHPPGYWLWQAGVDEARAYFVSEIADGLRETLELAQPVRAGFIKIACEANLDDMPAAPLEAAALASLETGAAIEVHTERGAAAEKIVSLFVNRGLSPDRLIICHIDKRPDPGLHRALAEQGVLLEYDTFFRPKYRPEQHVWPLLEKMVAGGFERQVALATDLADAALWSRLGKGPGLAGLLTQIVPQLQDIGFKPATIKRLAGENIASRLARQAAG